MTKFQRSEFNYHGGYLTYGNYPARGQFVARFKHCPRDRAGFVSFLIKNFTVEEYFAAMAAGGAPAEILRSRGYISKTIRLVLETSGYPATQAGFDDYIRNPKRI